MCQLKKVIEQGRIYKGRGSGGSTPTPRQFLDFL